jgi:alcohol dehydrogenase (cytochrome c)
MEKNIAGRIRVVVATLAVGSLMASTVGVLTTTASASPTTSGSWPYSNGNLANTRVALGSTITLANVSTLKKIWTFTLKGNAATNVGGFGTLAANPIVVNGVVYLQDLHCNVYALSLTTGKLIWEYKVNRKEISGPGPNGVAVVDGVVYGLTPRTAFALNAASGRTIWSNDHLLKKEKGIGEGSFGIQPQVADGRVYLATQYGEVPGGGVLFALNAATGAELWSFKTVPDKDKGVENLGVGAGGAWETPLVGADGSVTFGIGNPYQYASSAYSEPGQLLYTDSDVNLDAATGKLRWYYQGVPDDFKDYDMQASPIAASAHGVPVVIGGGKMGIVYEMNATTGALIWKTPVGVHNGHDNDSLRALEGTAKLKLPLIFSPGGLGGILTNMAVDGGTVYLATCNLPFIITTGKEADGLPDVKSVSQYDKVVSGDVEALNLATGKVEWDTKVNNLPLGAVTVSNDVVFTTLFNGELLALNRSTGAIVFEQKLPNNTNAPIAIAGNTVIIPAGAPKGEGQSGDSKIVAYAIL